MISERSQVQLSGKIISVELDDVCKVTFWGLVMGAQPESPTPRDVARLLNDVAVEASEIRDRIEELLQQRREPTPPAMPLYEDVRALTSHHAREVAYRRFYADGGNHGLVLCITSCEAVTHNKEGENVYRVLGYTKPRQKALRKRLVEAEGGPA